MCGSFWAKLRKQKDISEVYYDYVPYMVEDNNHILEYTKYIFTKYESGKECWNLDIYYSIRGYIEKTIVYLYMEINLVITQQKMLKKLILLKLAVMEKLFGNKSLKTQIDFIR